MTEEEFKELMSRKLHYKLVDNKPVNCDFLEYVQFYNTGNSIVKQSDPLPGVKVSTVFMGINLNFFSKEPVCFEMMIFGGKYDQTIRRYKTYEEALDDHHVWCTKIIDK